jgi:hypothetical protein
MICHPQKDAPWFENVKNVKKCSRIIDVLYMGLFFNLCNPKDFKTNKEMKHTVIRNFASNYKAIKMKPKDLNSG